MIPTISLLHATYRRTEKAMATMRQWIGAAHNPTFLEYVVAVNDDDADSVIAFRQCDLCRVVSGPYKGSAPAWNDAARAATGRLLIQVSDDFVAPDGWDTLLQEIIGAQHFSLPWDTPFVIRVSDGFRKDSLMCMAICSRAYMELDGYFLLPAFRSVFSDDWFTYRALTRAREGSAVVIDARSLVFRHDHPYHTGGELDETYKRQNSPEAYDLGSRLFDALAPDWRDSGLVDWRK